jgi:hypothetical protein
MDNGLAIAAAFWAADRAMAARATGNREKAKGPSANFRCAADRARFGKDMPLQHLRAAIDSNRSDDALYAAITEPHPRLGMQARR